MPLPSQALAGASSLISGLRRTLRLRLRPSHPSIRSKAVVDAEFHRLDGLLNVNPWHDFGDTSNRSGQ